MGIGSTNPSVDAWFDDTYDSDKVLDVFIDSKLSKNNINVSPTLLLLKENPQNNLFKKDEEDFKSRIINSIENKFGTYINPSCRFAFFKKLSRSFDQITVIDMQNEITENIQKGYIGKTFIVIQQQINYINNIKNCNTVKSSLKNRLIDIQNELKNQYRLESYIHESFQKFNLASASRNFYNTEESAIEKYIMNALDDTTNGGGTLELKLTNTISAINNILSNKISSLSNTLDASKKSFLVELETNLKNYNKSSNTLQNSG